MVLASHLQVRPKSTWLSLFQQSVFWCRLWALLQFKLFSFFKLYFDYAIAVVPFFSLPFSSTSSLLARPVHRLYPRPCCESSPPRLPISVPPTGLVEYFFNSLAAGVPYSLIFWHFWLFFVFKFVVVLLLVVRGSKAYLVCLHLGQKSTVSYYFKSKQS